MARVYKKVSELALRRTPYHTANRYAEYMNLLLNAVTIKSKGSDELPFYKERFVKRQLLEGGAVGYDKITKEFYQVYGEGLDIYGNPTTLHLVTMNGRVYERDACYDKDPEGAYRILCLNDDSITLGAIISETTDFMLNCDVAIRQNIEAIKTPFVAICKDEKLRLSVEQAIMAKETGKPVIVVSPELGDALKSVDFNVDFIAEDVRIMRDNERDQLLNKLGIITANVSKKERVQSAEVMSTKYQATDYIYMIIDTFNKQMETYDIPYEMVYNGSMDKENGENVNEDGKGGNENAE